MNIAKNDEELGSTKTWVRAVYWIAIALLVLNDHLLKGAAPGWITGKLSDFAFLIVAPVLFVACVPRRFANVRQVAFFLPIAFFVAINVSQAQADAAVAFAATFGVRRALWADPTDLVALVLAPLAWRMAFPAGFASARDHVSSRAALVFAALACAATSLPPADRYPGFVVNRTGARQSLTMRRNTARTAADCSKPLTELVAVERASTATATRTELAPSEATLLHPGYATAKAPLDARCTLTQQLDSDEEPGCTNIVVLAHEAAGAVIVRTTNFDIASCNATGSSDPAATVELRSLGTNGIPTWVASAGIEMTVLTPGRTP